MSHGDFRADLLDRLNVVPLELPLQRAIGSAGGAPPVGVYRPGLPYRVLLEEAERAILEGAIAEYQGQMAKAARAQRLERSHLYEKARGLGLREAKED